MASYYLSPLASFLQLLNDTGLVQPGLLMWTYAAGTSTPTTTWTDITGVTPNSNPIQLGSNGRLPNVSVWQQGGVPIKIQFSTNAGTVGSPVFGNQVGPTFDQVSGINDPASTLSSLANAASGSGADLVANAVRSYDIFSSMRAANVPSLTAGETLIVFAEGGSAVGDNLAGSFYWSPSSSVADDGVNVIKPAAVGSGNGRYIRLSQNNLYYSAFKAASTQRTNNTISNDPDLALVIGAAGTYELTMTLFFTGISSGAQGIQWQLAYTGTVTNSGLTGNGLVNGAASTSRTTGFATPYAFATINTSGFDWYYVAGTVTVSNSGTINLQWAQNTTSANATQLSLMSRLSARKIA
jgi:hypothetical protein